MKQAKAYPSSKPAAGEYFPNPDVFKDDFYSIVSTPHAFFVEAFATGVLMFMVRASGFSAEFLSHSLFLLVERPA